jgi:hypothetical protein
MVRIFRVHFVAVAHQQPRSLLDFILPLVLFPCLSAAAKRLVFQNVTLMRTYMVSSECSLGGPYRLPYTGVDRVDQKLCALVSIFQVVMSSDFHSFLDYFVWSGGFLVVLSFMYMEAARDSRPSWLPLLFGILIQMLTFGVTIPLYWLIFLLFALRCQPDRAMANKIASLKAEATLFGLLFGAFLPTYLVTAMRNPYMTALWQIFPIFTSALQKVYSIIRSKTSSTHTTHGTRTNLALLLYTGCSLVSIYTHANILIPMLKSPSSISKFLLPSLTPLEPSDSLQVIVLDLLQWDFVFGCLSSVIVMLWFARSLRGALSMLMWLTLAIPCFGPSAAIAGVLAWREITLN